jgi:predicted GNAT family acetyltransferase
VPEASRYELRLGDRLIGFAAYEPRGDALVFTHTEIDKACEGRGFGSRLVGDALADAERRGLRVVPLCPFVRWYLKRTG